jgi:hypothetical protein
VAPWNGPHRGDFETRSFMGRAGEGPRTPGGSTAALLELPNIQAVNPAAKKKT